jgi:lipopolysaccharide assembly outer membrane protein LptD (OstA)
MMGFVLAASVALASPVPHPARTVPPAASPTPLPSAGASLDVGVWTVHASSVDANFKTGDFSTPNKVVMLRNGGDITADRAHGNYKKKIVYLVGHVVMHDTTGNYGGIAGASPAPGSSAPSTLTADAAQVDGASRTYVATGHVHYVQGDTVVDADSGTLDDRSHELFLKGHVHIRQGRRSIIADTVHYNTVSGAAHAQGDVILQFPGEIRRSLATPRPINIPKNPLTKPVRASPPVAP